MPGWFEESELVGLVSVLSSGMERVTEMVSGLLTLSHTLDVIWNTGLPVSEGARIHTLLVLDVKPCWTTEDNVLIVIICWTCAV